jgi:mRNA interferase YafQ
MRTINRAGQFRRDYKRELKGLHGKTLADDLKPVFRLLQADQPLPETYHDHHPLYGNWKGRRECHIKPDLLLIYYKIGDDVLRLDRLGSHSELGI